MSSCFLKRPSTSVQVDGRSFRHLPLAAFSQAVQDWDSEYEDLLDQWKEASSQGQANASTINYVSGTT